LKYRWLDEAMQALCDGGIRKAGVIQVIDCRI